MLASIFSGRRSSSEGTLQPVAERHPLELLIRYGVASAVALVIDMGSFLALLAIEFPAAPASALSYSIGILTHWLLSSRTVFTGRVAERGPARTRQKALFVGSALVGLALTTGIVGIGDALGFDPRLAKLVAIGVSFACTWLLRSQVVFRHGSGS